jgi:HD superfamily phosphohydrolase YqeK
MTNPEIIELAETYGFDRHISKTTHDIYWECDEEDLLKFARKIFEEGQQEEIRRQKTGIGYVNGMLVVDEF